MAHLDAMDGMTEVVKDVPRPTTCPLVDHCRLLGQLLMYGRQHDDVRFTDFVFSTLENCLRETRHHMHVLRLATLPSAECKCWECRIVPKVLGHRIH